MEHHNPGYGAHCYPREKVIFPVVSHHGVLQQQQQHPGTWHTLENGQARETKRSGEANVEVTFHCMGLVSPHQSAQLGWKFSLPKPTC